MKSRRVVLLSRAALLAVCGWMALSGVGAALAQPNSSAQEHITPPDSGDRGRSEQQAPDPETSIVRARAFLGLGDYDKARAEAEIALVSDANSPGALRVLAAVEEETGRWRHAARHWARVADLTGDKAAAARRDALVSAHPSYIGATGFFEGAPDVDQLSGIRLDYVRRSLDGPEWTSMLENRIGSADTVTRLDGTIASAHETKQRLNIGLADDFRFARIGLDMSLTEEAVGARLSIGRFHPAGSFELTAGYDEPYWAYAAGLVNDATYNHVALSFSHSAGRWSLRGRLAGNEYSVRDENSVARSIAGAAGVDYALGDDDNAARVTYILDFEHFDSIGLRTRSNSTQYAVMPFVDRTVHSAGIYKTYGARDGGSVTIGAGYRRDSESGAQGAYGSFGGETSIADAVRGGVRLEYSDVSTRGVSNEPWVFAELYLRRKF